MNPEEHQVNTTNFITVITEHDGKLTVFAYRKDKKGKALVTKNFVLGISALIYYTKDMK